MKKILVVILAGTLFCGAFAGSTSAWVFVPGNGDTGWQTYTYTAGAGGFMGIAGFVVSNAEDDLVPSQLLIDHLSQGGAGNSSFETSDFTGFTLGSNSNGAVISGPFSADSGNNYAPTQGNWMSSQYAADDLTPMFTNAYGQPGTNGSLLETPIAVDAGKTFSFDWAFLSHDSDPYLDFSAFYLKDLDGNIVFQDGLGQTETSLVPLPPAALLFGSGLLGLAALGGRRRRRCQSPVHTD